MYSSATLPIVEELRERIRRLESGSGRTSSVPPFGLLAVDLLLSGGGLALRALHEVAGGGSGAIDGAAAALFAAGIAARTHGQILWCVTRQDLFAPALTQAGLIPDRVIYVEAGDEPSVLACFGEGLRHGGLGAVVAAVARLSMTASRRVQLAAESSGTIGIAVRRCDDEPKRLILGNRRHQSPVGAKRRSLRPRCPCQASDAPDAMSS